MRAKLPCRTTLLGGGALAALAAGLAATPPAAQEGGRLLSFDLSQRLEAQSNPDQDPDGSDASLAATTELGATISSSTPTSDVSLSFDGRLRREFGDGADDALTFEGPDVRLDYETRSANAKLETRLSYSERDISYIDPLDPALRTLLEALGRDDVGDISGEGTRKRLEVSARTEWGLQDPFGLAFSVQGRDLSYEDVTSSELQDSRAYSAELEARFDIRPTLRVTSAIGYQYVEEGSLEEETVGLGASINYLRPTVTYSLGGLVDVVEGETRAGITAGLGGVLPRGGTYDASVGVTRTIDETTVFTADAGYTAPLTPLSQVEIDLERSVEDDIDEGEIVSSALDATYTRELTPLTQMTLGASWLRESDTGGGDAETDARLSASLTRQLTRDWGLSLGVSREFSDGTGGTATSETVFFQISRSFVTTF